MTSFKPNYLSKFPPPKNIMLEVRASTYELGRGLKYVVHNIHQLSSPMVEVCPGDISSPALPGCPCAQLSIPMAEKLGKAGTRGKKLSVY